MTAEFLGWLSVALLFNIRAHQLRQSGEPNMATAFAGLSLVSALFLLAREAAVLL